MGNNKHENYGILNLIGYGLAKFDKSFVDKFGFETKSNFYNYLVETGVAKTASTIKNRQDLFDPFFDNPRKGWWQKGDAYIHRKDLIDSLFGKENVDIIKRYLKQKFSTDIDLDSNPIIESKFKQLQLTGIEAELFFIKNFSKVERFENGKLEDARYYGDGYDFQISSTTFSKYYLAEVKGIRENHGSIRMTSKEFEKALEYKNDYSLIVISHLNDIPKINEVINPANSLEFKKTQINRMQVNYHSNNLSW